VTTEDQKRSMKAASEVADPHRTMPDEDLASPYPDDARHWIEVYGQLVAFKSRMIEDTTQELRRHPELQSELGDIDLTLLTAELNRLSKRLELWTERLRHLTEDGPSASMEAGATG
jgi:hypothetical protein